MHYTWSSIKCFKLTHQKWVGEWYQVHLWWISTHIWYIKYDFLFKRDANIICNHVLLMWLVSKPHTVCIFNTSQIISFRDLLTIRVNYTMSWSLLVGAYNGYIFISRNENGFVFEKKHNEPYLLWMSFFK